MAMQNVVIVIRSFNVYDLQNLYRNMMNLYSSKSGGGGGGGPSNPKFTL